MPRQLRTAVYLGLAGACVQDDLESAAVILSPIQQL